MSQMAANFHNSIGIRLAIFEPGTRNGGGTNEGAKAIMMTMPFALSLSLSPSCSFELLSLAAAGKPRSSAARSLDSASLHHISAAAADVGIRGPHAKQQKHYHWIRKSINHSVALT